MTWENKHLSRVKYFVLNATLADYPEGYTYEQIQDMIGADDCDVTVWEQLEDMSTANLIEFQDDLKWGVENLFKESQQKAIYTVTML